jgi:PAT family acetyl-CoA transporter-like MFS transporter 1
MSNELRERKNVINKAQEIDMVNEKQSKQLKHSNDQLSIALLLLLYTLQGIPMGLCGSLPLIMKERGVSYEGLSLFSLVSIPFSMKLLWAPLVDSCYIRSFGRRKTWLIPVQIITGLIMLLGSRFIDDWMGNDENESPNVSYLTMFFLTLYFLMATQDIAVDGWALTMLSRDNVGYASMCNSIGQSLGFFMANQGFIALSDSNWCERYLGMENEAILITLAGFMKFWGWVFISTTIFIWIFKKEDAADQLEETAGFFETCKQVVQIFHLPSIRTLVMVLLTCKIAFAPVDAIFGFKLQVYIISLI